MTAMTLDELNQFLDLVQKLQKNREILESLETRAVPGGQVLTGMPHAPGVSNKVEMFAVEIADMRARVEQQQAEVEEQQKAVEAFIAGIEPDQVRIACRLRFVRALQWKEVAYLLGTRFTEDSVYRMVRDYFRQTAPVVPG